MRVECVLMQHSCEEIQKKTNSIRSVVPASTRSPIRCLSPEKRCAPKIITHVRESDRETSDSESPLSHKGIAKGKHILPDDARKQSKYESSLKVNGKLELPGKVGCNIHKTVSGESIVPNRSLVNHSIVPSSPILPDIGSSSISATIRTESVICRATSLSNLEMMTINRQQSFEPLTKRKKLERPNDSNKCDCHPGCQNEREKKIDSVSGSIDIETTASSPRMHYSKDNSSSIKSVQSPSNDHSTNYLVKASQSRALPQGEFQNDFQTPAQESVRHCIEDDNRDRTDGEVSNEEKLNNSRMENDQDILARACHAIGLDSDTLDLSQIPEISQSSAHSYQKLPIPQQFVQPVNHPVRYGLRRQVPPHPLYKETGAYPYGYKMNQTNYSQNYAPGFPLARAQMSSQHQKIPQVRMPPYYHPAPSLPTCRMSGKSSNFHNYPAFNHERLPDPRANIAQNFSNQMYRMPQVRASYPHLGNDHMSTHQRYSYHVSRFPPGHSFSNSNIPRPSSCRYALQDQHRNIVYSSGIYSPPILQRDSGISNKYVATSTCNVQQSHHIVPHSQSSPQYKQRLEYSPISSPISPPLSPLVDLSLYNKSYDKSDYHQWATSLEKDSGANVSNSSIYSSATHSQRSKESRPMYDNISLQSNKEFQQFFPTDHRSLLGSVNRTYSNTSSPVLRICESASSTSQHSSPTTIGLTALPRSVSEEAASSGTMSDHFYNQNYRRGFSDHGRQRSNSYPGSELALHNDRNAQLSHAMETGQAFSPSNLLTPVINMPFESPNPNGKLQMIQRSTHERKEIQHPVPKVELIPLNPECRTFENDENTSTRSVQQNLIPQRASPNSTQKSSCQYKSSASMFMSISETSTSSISHPCHYAPSENTNQPSIQYERAVTNPRVLADAQRSSGITTDLIISSLENDAFSSSETIGQNMNEIQRRARSTHAPATSTRDDVTSNQFSNDASQPKSTPLQQNSYIHKVKSMDTSEKKETVSSPMISSGTISTSDHVNKTHSEVVWPSVSKNSSSIYHHTEEDVSNRSKVDDQTSCTQPSNLSEKNHRKSMGKVLINNTNSKTIPHTKESKKTNSDSKENCHIESSQRKIEEKRTTETTMKATPSSKTKTPESSTMTTDAQSKLTDKETQNVKLDEKAIKNNGKLSHEHNEINCIVSPNVNHKQASKRSKPENKKPQQVSDFRTKLIPVLEHLLSVPEAEALKHLRDTPEELLSHIVMLWGGNNVPSKASDPADRMREDFLTMVHLLFKPHLMLKWGWNRALPDQILDDLLKPSSDCGIRFLSMNLRDFRQHKHTSLKMDPLEAGRTFGGEAIRNNRRTIPFKKQIHLSSEGQIADVAVFGYTKPENGETLLVNESSLGLKVDGGPKTSVSPEENILVKCSIRKCQIVLKRIDDITSNSDCRFEQR